MLEITQNPELTEAQRRESEEFLAHAEGEGRKFIPTYPSSELAEKAEKEVIHPPKSIERTEDEHTEAGIPLKNVYSTDKERAEAASRLIATSHKVHEPGVANDVQSQMEQLFESREN